MRRPLNHLSAVLLALASSPALALGLGDIHVLSRPGQPLLAEIAVISADPAELQELRVGLASPLTFERVGLQRPSGLVSELQFELARDAQGRAVVRVTSQRPVDTPSLAFLIEADWGQGRLVREYAALVDAPASAATLSEPEIVVPAAVPSNAIVREPPVVPMPPGGTDAPAPAASPSPDPRATASTAAAGDTVTVRAGQTLSAIAHTLARGQEVSRERAMIALLRANPDAFIRGNIHLLRQGAVLRLPDAAALAAVEGAEAAAMVREHTAQWRRSRTIPQPATLAAPVVAAGERARPPSGARLEIAPAVAATAAGAGTTTGTGAGNEGDMLANEPLRQAREDVAAGEAEIAELKQRVAELEALQARQQALVALKDTELAAAQARLAQLPGEREAAGPWYWLALPVLLLVALGAWLVRRRRPSPLPPAQREDSDDSALSSAVPAGAGLDVLAERAPWQAETASPPPARPGAAASQDPLLRAGPWPDASPPSAAAGQAARDTAPVPALEAEADAPVADPGADDPVPAYARQAEQRDEYRGVFEPPAGDAAGHRTDADGDAAAAVAGRQDLGDAGAADDAIAADAADRVDRAGHDRLELAIACLDLGEDETARGLLEALLHGDDPTLRAQARELLARLR